MANLMKDQMGENAVAEIADLIVGVIPDFDKDSFQQNANQGLADRELKQRVIWIRQQLVHHLPKGFKPTAEALLSLPEPPPIDGNWGEFTFWPILDYVADQGLNEPELALATLKTLTPYFTAEFSIRPYVVHHQQLTLKTALQWTKDESEHVRRLASEGIRPRLPWGSHLVDFITDPTPLLPILNALKDDDSLYVRRSVANNLNDIAKDHPDKVIAVCQEWQTEASKARLWLIKHGLRTLVKQGHPDVFPLLGYTANPEVEIEITLSSDSITLGESLTMEVKLHSLVDVTQEIVVDYAIAFVKANGQYSQKVFKGKNCQIAAKDTISWQKKHVFKPVTTRSYYSGQHQLTWFINGRAVGDVMTFDLQL